MKKQTRCRYGFVTVVLTAILLLSACSTSGMRQHAAVDFNYRKNGYVDENASLNGANFAATPEEKEVLSGMREMLSNEKAMLYMGDSYDIAVLDKQTGAIWFSNRALYEDSQILSEADRSQLAIQFYNSSDTLTTMYSFPDSYDGNGLDQVTVKTDAEAVNVTYAFGTRLDDLLMAPGFTAETYNNLIEKAQTLIDAGELTVMQVGRFKVGYIQLIYDNLSSADQEAYTKQYPMFPKLGEIYAMKPNLTNLQKREIEKVSKALGLNEQMIDAEVEKLGELSENQEQSPYFEITLEYQLDGKDLIVTMDPKKIVEQESYKLTRIELLGGLGAVAAAEDNYLFVPDGSGALIPAKQENELLQEITVPFYGSDLAIDIQDEDKLFSDCVFPVFGLKEGDNALFAVAESGEAMAGLTASLPDDTSSYARITPYYAYRALDTISLNGLGERADKNVYSEKISAYPFVMRYHFLYGENADYSGMARYYRQYLDQIGALPKAEETEASLDIDFLGAFSKLEMRYGIQVNATLAATTFKQAGEIVADLKNKGLTSLDVQYLGVFNGGLDFSLINKAEVEQILGGKDGFMELYETFHKQQIGLFPEADFSRVYRQGNGLNQASQLSRYLSKKYAQMPNFLPADNKRSLNRISYQISATAFGNLVKQFDESFQILKCPELYVSSLGSLLSADYHEGDEADREECKLLTTEALQKLTASGYRLKLDGGNAYVLPYASALTNVPIDSSRYTLYGDTVPFVGMVLHGKLPYTGPVINRQGNQKEALLKSIESGAGLHYMLMSENPIVFANTDYSEYYSLSADQWLDTIAETWKQLQPVYAQLTDATMERHERLQNGVYACYYSNGSCVLINYTDNDVLIEGQTVKAQHYALKGGVEIDTD